MTAPSPPPPAPAITLLSTAQIAGEIAAHKWQDINLSDSGSQAISIVILVERILSILLIRLLAILHKREVKKSSDGGGTPRSLFPNLQFLDLSTSGICQSIINHPEKETLQWPEVVTQEVIQQLHDYIYNILDMYRSVSYHNREHAYHVFMSGHKLLDLVLCEYDWSSALSTSAIPIKKPDRATYGIKSDPLLQLAFLYAALVHDVDHTGVSNRQLVLESDELAIMYNDQSCAEQRSLAIAFSKLMKKEYASLKKVLFETDEEYMRFRKTVIDLVLCTDIASPERVQIVKSKWKEAFGDKKKSRSSIKMMEADKDDYDKDQRQQDLQSDIKDLQKTLGENSIHEKADAIMGSPKTIGILRNSITSDANLLTVPNGSKRPRSGSRGSVRRHCLKHNTAVYGNVLIDIDIDTSTSLVQNPRDFNAILSESLNRESPPPRSRLRRLFSRKSQSMSNRRSHSTSFSRRKPKRIRKKPSRKQRLNYDSDHAQGDSDVALEDEDNSDVEYAPANGITDISGLTTSYAFPLRDSAAALPPPPGKGTMNEILNQYDDDLSYDSEGSSESSSALRKDRKKVLNRQSKSFGDELKPETEKSHQQSKNERKIDQVGETPLTSNRGLNVRSSLPEGRLWGRSASTMTLDRRFTDPPESSFDRKKFHFRLGIRRALDLSGNQISLYDGGSKKHLIADDIDEPDALKAVVVLEQLLKASDVAANMQSWETAVLWCKRLFKEQMTCYKEGRGANPVIGWHENQIAFFESYTMPLACRLVETGVFEAEAVRDFVNGVRQNNIRWMIEGTSVVQNMIREWEEENPDFSVEP